MNIYSKLKTRYFRHYKEAKIDKYIANLVTILFFILALQLFDYFTLDTELSFIEMMLGVLILFIFAALIYTAVSPTFWGWLKKKIKKSEPK